MMVLYYAHVVDDPATAARRIVARIHSLVNAGKVRYVAASNITASRLADAIATSDREGLARYVAVQPNYNLMHRAEYESDLRALCAREALSDQQRGREGLGLSI